MDFLDSKSIREGNNPSKGGVAGMEFLLWGAHATGWTITYKQIEKTEQNCFLCDKYLWVIHMCAQIRDGIW